MPDTYTVHGIEFKQAGRCNQCGLCCDQKCSHLEILPGKEYGTPGSTSCRIHDKLADFCEEHGETHQYCIDFPNHPWLWVLQEGKCSMRAVCVDPKDDARVNALTNAFSLKSPEA